MSTTNSQRTLLVANEVPNSAAVEELTDGTGVLVVAPALNSRLKHWLSDEDDARRRAADRLALSLERLASEGVDAQGWVGDPDPVQAIDDALHLFPAERIVVATHPDSSSNWLARDLLARARQRFALPIRHLEVIAGPSG
jgi:hypothetical protein